MSLQRAQVNCKRCYELAIAQSGGGEGSQDFKQRKVDTAYQNSRLYAARNEAMRALEEESAVDLAEAHLIKSALDACVSCDYSAPKICRIIDASSNEKPKEKGKT